MVKKGNRNNVSKLVERREYGEEKESTMDKLLVKIKNCYGINSLENEFDFTKGKSTQVIYAPNGVMKTSFANVFDDYSKDVESTDLIFPQKDSIRHITTNDGSEIATESVFVIRPYEKSYKSDRVSTLLVSDDLRKQYDEVHEKIGIEKENLLEVLKSPSGLKKGIQDELCDSFGEEKNNLFQLLSKIEDRINDSDSEYSHIIYSKIFNEKVVAFLDVNARIKLTVFA
jgi:hypothetical protein